MTVFIIFGLGVVGTAVSLLARPSRPITGIARDMALAVSAFGLLAPVMASWPLAMGGLGLACFTLAVATLYHRQTWLIRNDCTGNFYANHRYCLMVIVTSLPTVIAVGIRLFP
jgi:hypothetical protein